MGTKRGPEPYLVSLHDAESGWHSIADRPAQRVVFSTNPDDGETHLYEGNLTVDQLFEALRPLLTERLA